MKTQEELKEIAKEYKEKTKGKQFKGFASVSNRKNIDCKKGIFEIPSIKAQIQGDSYGKK